MTRLDRTLDAAFGNELHVSLAMHRAPGYTVSREGREPGNLWKDSAVQKSFVDHWLFLTERYADVSPDLLSFNLLNEPGPLSSSMSREDHDSVMRQTIHAIRQVSACRPIVLDGLNYGREPHTSLLDVATWQSCRGYDPFILTHYGTGRVHEHFPDEPTWPLHVRGKGTIDRDWLRKRYESWFRIAEHGVPVHCGEFGCSRAVPHAVMLRWLADLLTVFDEMQIGFALWNLRGAFGILDSGRQEATPDARAGGQLDRAMLDVLQAHLP